MDKLASMRAFVRIVETGSLTAAANDLGTSLPTVVRTLAALEHDLGVPLLKRTTRRIHLTDEGVQYLERCRLILSAVQEAEDVLVARRRDLQGKLTITASVHFGRRYIAPFLVEFLTRHPGHTADLLLVNRMVNLVEEGADIASGSRISRIPLSWLFRSAMSGVSSAQARNTSTATALRRCQTTLNVTVASDTPF